MRRERAHHFFLIAIVVLSLAFARGVQASQIVKEITLNPAGTAYEIHAGPAGTLWISDYGSGEIVRVVANGDVTAFEVGGAPSDAIPDGSGAIWWLDGTQLSRLDPDSAAFDTWDAAPMAGWLWGTAIEGAGKVWITDSSSSLVHRFEYTSGNLCTFSVPSGGQGYYPALANGQLWLGDTVNARLLRLDIPANTWTWWQLPTGSYPYQVALDGENNAWYADNALKQLGRLAYTTHQLALYPPPGNGNPRTLAVAGTQIWYTDQAQVTIGILNPSTAPASPQSVAHSGGSASSTCQKLAAATHHTAPTHTVTPAWSNATYPLLASSGGWTIFALPAQAQPTGITYSGETWLVDAGRQKLARIAPGVDENVYVPLVRR